MTEQKTTMRLFDPDHSVIEMQFCWQAIEAASKRTAMDSTKIYNLDDLAGMAVKYAIAFYGAEDAENFTEYVARDLLRQYFDGFFV